VGHAAHIAGLSDSAPRSDATAKTTADQHHTSGFEGRDSRVGIMDTRLFVNLFTSFPNLLGESHSLYLYKS
jgi:hypothetical protein